MNATIIEEPSLEFAGGQRHLDPRFGVAEYGPADLTTPGAPRSIKAGLLGEQANVEQTQAWLERGRVAIAAKSADRPGLWPPFPGFSPDAGYHSELIFDPRMQRPIKPRAIAKLDGLDPRKRVDAAVEMYLDELQTLVQDGHPDVVVCCIPDVLIDLDTSPNVGEPKDAVDSDTAESERPVGFHDLLKARAMSLRVPLQLVKASTYDPKRAGRQKRKTWKQRQRQDDASIAWNFFTALYYKAGGTPWRMVRAATDLDACYVGVAFFRTADGKGTATSVAQVYNQRGDGVVVRGGPAHRSNDDRQLHISEQDSYEVLKEALTAYRQEHRHAPARIVVHKTSPFDEHEQEGMLRAADDLGLDSCELVWITNPTTRLYRNGYHPPRRGTLLELAADHGVLYTRGSVEWYGTYPGMYVPRPIALRAAYIDRSLTEVAEEVLALSKMNWNSTRFDGRLPVSLRTLAKWPTSSSICPQMDISSRPTRTTCEDPFASVASERGRSAVGCDRDNPDMSVATVGVPLISVIFDLLAAARAVAEDDGWISRNSTLVVGVVGIVFSGFVGPSIVAYFTGRRELAKDARTLTVARQDDLRDVLDEAAQVLSGAVGRLRPLLAAALAGEDLPKDPADFLGSLAPLGHRLRLRLPDADPVVSSYDEAVEQLRAVAQATGSQAAFDATVVEFETARDDFLTNSRAKLRADLFVGKRRK